jgi:putative Holliday junction resolvase
MRVLGVDFGSKRVGLAISDETGTVATPIGNVPGEAIAKVCASILQVVHDRHVTEIVVGVPWKLDGNPSDQTRHTLQFIDALKAAAAIPVNQWDERLTSVQANRVLIEGNVRRKERREKIDQLAAQLMLQSYLDAQHLTRPDH